MGGGPNDYASVNSINNSAYNAEQTDIKVQQRQQLYVITWFNGLSKKQFNDVRCSACISRFCIIKYNYNSP